MNLNKRAWIKVATIGALSAAVLIGCGKKEEAAAPAVAAVAAASDTLGETGRAAIADEIGQMADELFARANTLSITGAPLFAGTAGAPAFVRDASGVVSYTGSNQNGTVPVAPGTVIERGVTGRQLFEFNAGGTPTNAFAVLSDLAAALLGGDTKDA